MINKMDRKGAISIEFALLLPFMLFFYIGTVSLLNIIACYQKVHITARAVADMVAQNADENITSAQLNNIISAASSTLWPFNVAMSSVTVSSFSQQTNSGTQTVLWSVGNKPLQPCSIYHVLDNLSTERQWSFIYSQVEYDDRNLISTAFNLIFPSVLKAEITMTPRNVSEIDCPDCKKCK